MRKLSPEEEALWQRVISTVTPLESRGDRVPEVPVPQEVAPPPPPGMQKVRLAPVRKAPAPAKSNSALLRRNHSENTLDGSWDKQLSRGLIAPESAIDLHGHNLASAYDRLERGLEQAIAMGDRVLLLVTGKPPRPESERPHARGAIRAAVGDWLASSRFSSQIAAVRNAHPRHGGQGALYIVIRRPKTR